MMQAKVGPTIPPGTGDSDIPAGNSSISFGEMYIVLKVSHSAIGSSEGRRSSFHESGKRVKPQAFRASSYEAMK